MSSEQTGQVTAKPRPKKAGGNSHPAASPMMLLAGRTIFVSFPPPAQVNCPIPFRALGTAAATTLMDPTARIVTPGGDLIGNLEANPPPPFTWSYVFNVPLPQGVPLALVVRGTNAMGQVEEVVVPFQCN
jgi:hypothetical protein